MIVSEIELFEVLAKELGREKAKSLVEYVEHKVDKRLEEKTNVFATKEDIAQLEVKIAQSEARLTLRMFYFWLGQVAVIAGLLAYFFNRH